MAITEFYVKGYKKLGLRNIASVHMFPKSKLQVILGTNGSGKSSLMQELSGLIADHSEYERDGIKRVNIHRRGDDYECISDFANGGRHYELNKNGKSIYSGHSSTAATAHIKAELGMTSDIHAVRIGTKRFTTMDKESRRQWFTNMSPENYSYAIQYYKRLAEASRDIHGSIKRTNIRLMQEKEKIFDAETEKRHRQDIQELMTAKSEMMQHWRPMEMTVEQALTSISDIDSKLNTLVNGFNESFKAFCNVKGYKDQQGIWDDISKTQSDLAVIDSQLSDIHEQIEVNCRLIEESVRSVGKDEASIKAQIAEVSRDIISVNMVMTSQDWIDTAQDALLAYDAVVPELIPLMDMLVQDPDISYTQIKHKEKHDKLQATQKSIEALENEITRLNALIGVFEHRALVDHTECPKCQHTWIRGYNQTEHDSAIKSRDTTSQASDILKKEYQEIHAFLEASSYQLQLLNQIGLLARANPILSPMWKGLTDKHFIRINPKSAIEYVRATRIQLELTVELSSYKDHLKELEVSLESAVSLSGINCQELQDKNTALENRLHTLQSQAYILQQSLVGYKKAQKAMEFQDRFIPEVDDMMAKRSTLIDKAEAANHHSAVNAIIMQLETDITVLERILSQADAQKFLINSLEKEVEDLKTKEKLMKAAMSALSPTNGLIAKGLTGFINHFVAQMNAVIEKVWLYPLVIKPIAITDDSGVDLDYKFAFTVDDKPAGKDVEYGSGAQKEIFDLAFMLVSMINLGMDDTEIFLDEFSIKMDYAHRKEAMKMVMDLVMTSNFSQIFMISHYESSYGTLGEADITVLCSENIQLPGDLAYNVNNEIKHK